MHIFGTSVTSKEPTLINETPHYIQISLVVTLCPYSVQDPTQDTTSYLVVMSLYSLLECDRVWDFPCV